MGLGDRLRRLDTHVITHRLVSKSKPDERLAYLRRIHEGRASFAPWFHRELLAEVVHLRTEVDRLRAELGELRSR